MDENKPQLTKKERREIKRQEKEAGRMARERAKKSGKALRFVVAAIIIIGVVGSAILVARTVKPVDESGIVSRQGIHWHPVLHIFISGKEEPIPANIGIGAIHQPIHTHDSDNVLHLEFSGLVKKEDITLKRFFEIWDKTFTSTCIFEFCNGEKGIVKMYVNGEPNTGFENYIMHDGDKIEVRYE